MIHLMAKLASNAYKDGKDAKPVAKELGFTGHKFWDIDGAQCHAVWNKEMYVLCFRGELDKLWEQVVEHQKRHKKKTFCITGHSLGAAMATLATSRFEEFTEVTQLTTFGSPRVGTRKFVNNI